MKQEEPEQIITGDIFEYIYLHEDKNVLFAGGKAAFGKSYSLSNDIEETCDNQCLDYFRTEFGLELISIKRASNVYFLMEMNKTLPQPIDTVSFHAGLRAQKHEGSYSGLYTEGSVGLKFDVWGFQLQYLLKARNLLPEENRYIEYDDEKDVLIFLGVQTSF